ncbi:N-acetylmuramoyl-L-alanine amidase [Endozoicomonas sp. SCSIO W0465]|uniref:N-acetylmuramoyl-L-alanine amidase n=1 Tax=Endozoicomonas sp. SCSIO W0465 TaxID=2918516 RepID=UPI0020762DB8|nr:N-acetylmuramoyl-L-alanine amidase [Endozoicomonas sp. SCSIO W0465]USE36490.1 N-acetylmuramoyl-L-alanine amidase [Endozoicomonas sp. SCSIO W0465]
MTLNVNRVKTANRDDWLIPVDYLVIHYTAVDLKDTLAIFTNPESCVSSHLVIDTDGEIYELVDCLNGHVHRGWHAGVSEWEGVHGLNDCSIGIELVNYNGNVFPFTDEQYHSLHGVMARFKEHYPNLRHPERVVGHEHIAGFRGKADPGMLFDWHRFYRENYPGYEAPLRPAVCPKALQERLMQLKASEPESIEAKSHFWHSVSLLTETTVRLIEEAKGTVGS